ncbi:MAG: hypothetical protein L0L69_00725, partial [Propionibacterium sp.]|nr:hypothetical protein [Propionibacterium sp.]
TLGEDSGSSEGVPGGQPDEEPDEGGAASGRQSGTQGASGVPAEGGTASGGAHGVAGAEEQIPGEGPRIVFVTEGEVTLRSEVPCGSASQLTLHRGEVAFVAACERALSASGHGRVIQCAAP